MTRVITWFAYFGKSAFLPQIITRLVIGFLFFQSGWGKLHHLSKTIEFFASIGVPFAKYQAPFVAGTEFVCGILILLGLATRVASIPLVIIMIVALRTAKWGDIHGAASLIEITEFLYLVLLLWLIAFGAGKISIDAWLNRKVSKS